MRVCLVTAYDLSRDGGVNRQVLGLAQALRTGGDEAVVLGPASGPVPPGCVGLAGVVGVPGNGSMAHIGLGVRTATTLRFFRQQRFDLLHLHAPLIPGPARQAAAYAHIPMVGTFHASAEQESRLSRSIRAVACRPLRRLHAAIAVSAVAQRFSRLIYPRPMHVIPCGIFAADDDDDGDGSGDTTPTFAPHRPAADTRAMPTAAQPLRILFVGRFCEPRKGLRYLLAAAVRLRARGLPVQVTVVGEGRRRKFAALAAPANTHFAGRVDDATLARHYRDADVFCAPSTGSESFGLVLIEAMAAGAPVVASSIPGYIEASQGCASLVPPKAVDELAFALWQLGTDHALRTATVAAAHARIRALHWHRLVPRVRRVYAEAITCHADRAIARAGPCVPA